MSENYSIYTKLTMDPSGFTNGINKAQKSAKTFQGSLSGMIQKMGSSGLVGSLGSVGLALGGVGLALGTAKKAFQAVAKVVDECSQAYKTQFYAEEQLRQAIQNSNNVTSESTERLLNYASALQKASNYGDEELLPMMTKLVATGRSEAETMKIMQTAIDMSASGAMSLDTAITQLNATMNGNIGRLGQQNAELKGLTEEELKNGKAVDILADKYKGMAEKSIDSSKQLKNAWGDLKETLGATFESALSPMRQFFAELIQGWADARKEREKYNEAEKRIEAGTDTTNDWLLKKESLEKQILEIEGDLQKQAEELAMTYEEAYSYMADWEKKHLQDLKDELQTVELQIKLSQKREESDRKLRERQEEQAKKDEERRNKKKSADEEAQRLIDAYNEKIAKQNIIWEQNAKIKGEEVSLEEKIKFYQDALVSTMSEANGLISENNSFYKQQVKIIQEMGKDLPKAVKAETDLVKVTKTQLKGAFTDTFKKIGASLAEGQASFEDFAQTAVSSISKILEALAEQLMAQSAVNLATGNFAGAGTALAGAASAMVASGALSGVASKMSAVAESTNDANTSVEKFKETLQSITESRFSKSGTISLGLVEMQDQLDLLREKQNKLYSENKSFFDYYTGGWNRSRKTLENAVKIGLPNAEKDLKLYDEYYNTIKQINEVEKQLAEALDNVRSTLDKSVAENRQVINSYKDFYGATVLIADSAEYQFKKYSTYLEMIKEEQKIGLQELEADVYETFQSFGKNIGEAMFKSFSDGSGKESFFNDMKGMIRETVLKMAVYTESFTEQLSEVGAKLVSALMGGEDLEEVTKTISDIYDDVARVAEGLENKLDGIFGKIEEEMGFIVSNFAKNMKSFKETIKDVTGDIGTTFINGLTEGITQGDFLGNIKDWLRKMMIQMVVYTDTMKVEIEEIGKRISAGITEGFTDTDLHEIRRDMSYMFEEATRKVSTIDSLLGGVFGGYATGTNSARKGLHLVGEAGPELVRFNGGEKVMNNRETNKALASGINGSTNNFNVTFNNTQDTTAFAMMSQLKQYNRQMAINGII